MDPGLLSGSGAGRGLCPGNRPPASAPGRTSRFFKRQSPDAPGGFSRFTASPASASVPGKSGTKQLSTSGSFFLAMGLSSDNGAAGLEAGLAGASLAILFFLSLFLSFTSVRLGAFLAEKAH